MEKIDFSAGRTSPTYNASSQDTEIKSSALEDQTDQIGRSKINFFSTSNSSPLFTTQSRIQRSDVKDELESSWIEDKEALQDKFTHFFEMKGYRLETPHSLITDDPSILFINSTIAPNKPLILNNIQIVQQASVQPCFRARESEGYLYAFSMFGITTDLEHLSLAGNDIIDFLVQCGFKRENLCVVLNPTDIELKSFSEKSFIPRQVHFLSKNNEKYDVTWNFGQALTGHGLTISAFLPNKNQNDDVMIKECIPLGNIIILKNNEGNTYIDVGFGVECIQSYFYNGEIYQIPFYQSLIDSFSSDFNENSKELVKELMGFHVLCSEGVKPAATKHGYILRKIQKRIYDFIMASKIYSLNRNGVFQHLYSITKNAFGSSAHQKNWKRSITKLEKEFKAHCESLETNEKNARKYLKKALKDPKEGQSHAFEQTLKDSYGLPSWSISKLKTEFNIENRYGGNMAIPIYRTEKGKSETNPLTSLDSGKMEGEKVSQTGNGAIKGTQPQPNPQKEGVDLKEFTKVDLDNIDTNIAFGKGVILSDQIVARFLKYFKENKHFQLGYASVIPKNDPTLLFVNSGMAPLKAYFLGDEEPPSKRLCNVQPCIRTNDIDDIGDRHHLSLFHMMGSWSIGDYYKKEAVQLAYGLLVNVLKFDPNKLYATYFCGDKALGLEADEESAQAWRDVGLKEDHIVPLPTEDNLWGPAGEIGPCGPCTEVFYDTGDEYAPPYQPGKPESFDTKRRYIEIWNAGVFMQLFKNKDGTFTPLKLKSVDTGSGLERMTMVMNGCETVYETNLLRPIVEWVKEVFKDKGLSPQRIRMLTDHIRTAVYLLSENVAPSNTGQGYIVRKLIRKCTTVAESVQVPSLSMIPIVEKVIGFLTKQHPHVESKRDFILIHFSAEIEQFEKTIKKGLIVINKAVEDLGDKKTFSGSIGHEIVTTHGVPLEILIDFLNHRGISFDMEGYKKADEEHRNASKAQGTFSNLSTIEMSSLTRGIPATKFVGYSDLKTVDAKILYLINKGKKVDAINEGEEFMFIVDITPFYANSGGQVGDVGTATNQNCTIEITDTNKQGVVFIHAATLKKGSLKVGDTIDLHVNSDHRAGVRRNHSATHLLHAALVEVVGKHALQKGSIVKPDGLRFDFQNNSGLTDEQIEKIEEIVNRQIINNTKVSTDVKSYKEATQEGAVALFGETYGDRVRVVKMGEKSKELCGGTHAFSTGDIGLFIIESEKAIAKGIRRIEALTGPEALKAVQARRKLVNGVTEFLGTQESEVLEKLKAFKKGKVEKSELTPKFERTYHLANGRIARLIHLDVSSTSMLKDAASSLLKSGTNIVVIVGLVDKDPKLSIFVDDKTNTNANTVVSNILKSYQGKGGGTDKTAQAKFVDFKSIEQILNKEDEFGLIFS